MSNKIILELWNHGTHNDINTPCGEVDIFNISGERIPSTFLEQMTIERHVSYKNDWFGELPTEKALKVEVEINNLGGNEQIDIDIINFSELPTK